MTPQQSIQSTLMFRKCAPYTYIVFDYDGTIATIPISWQQVRSEFRNYLQVILPDLRLPDAARVDEMEAIALHSHPDCASEILQFRIRIESAVTERHIPNDSVIALIHQLNRLEPRPNFYVLSNNLRRTVETGLRELGLLDCFQVVLGIDSVGMPKPHVTAVKMLENDYGVECSQCILVGDSEKTDGEFCRNTGIAFLNVSQQSPEKP